MSGRAKSNDGYFPVRAHGGDSHITSTQLLVGNSVKRAPNRYPDPGLWVWLEFSQTTRRKPAEVSLPSFTSCETSASRELIGIQILVCGCGLNFFHPLQVPIRKQQSLVIPTAIFEAEHPKPYQNRLLTSILSFLFNNYSSSLNGL